MNKAKLKKSTKKYGQLHILYNSSQQNILHVHGITVADGRPTTVLNQFMNINYTQNSTIDQIPLDSIRCEFALKPPEANYKRD